MSFDDDLTSILNDWDVIHYTEQAYPHPSSKSIEIGCLFRYRWDEDAKDNLPTVTAKSSTFTNLKTGDKVRLVECKLYSALEGAEYVVRQIEHDGIGKVSLTLEKV